MRKKKITTTISTVIISLIMTGVLIAGTLTGCSGNSDNSDSDNKESLQGTDAQSSTEILAENADDNKEAAQSTEGVEDKSITDVTIESEEADSDEANAEESTQYSDGEIDFSQYKIYLDLLKDMNYDDLKIIVWNSQKGGRHYCQMVIHIT